jgi:Ohr subfamily peroxiredoxin
MSPSSSSQKPKNAALMSSKSTSDCHHHWKRKLYPGEEKSVLTDRAEQLFAVGYAACFHSGLLSVAQGRKLDASDSTLTAHVGIGSTGRGGFGLAVALDLHAPNLSRADAEDLMCRAHALCPYSSCRLLRGHLVRYQNRCAKSHPLNRHPISRSESSLTALPSHFFFPSDLNSREQITGDSNP